MAAKWRDLPPAGRTAIVVAALVDGVLRAWALRDLAGRDDAAVNGPRWLWRAALTVVSSSGVLPAAYLLRGRR